MDRTPHLSPTRVAIAVAALITAGALLSLALATPLATPRVARAALAAPAIQGAAVRQAAIELAGHYGLAGTPGTAVRSADLVTGTLVDTVDFRLGDGRLAAQVVRATDGRLERVVDLTEPPAGPGPGVDASGAPAAARRLLGQSGLVVPTSPPVATWDAGMDAWSVRWTRAIDGIPAPTDGLVMWVRPSGRLKALDDMRSPVADAPPRPVPAVAATHAVQDYARGLRLDLLPSLAYDDPHLAWVLPNVFVDPASALDPSILRLAWAVSFSYIPPGWTERHSVEIDVDAATGALIGGTETA